MVTQLLSRTHSRRGILATGVKVAYVTPLVLASMSAAPAMADPLITGDYSEDQLGEIPARNTYTLLMQDLAFRPGKVPADLTLLIPQMRQYQTKSDELMAAIVANASPTLQTDIFANGTGHLYGPVGGTVFNNAILPANLTYVTGGTTLNQATIKSLAQAIAYEDVLFTGMVNALVTYQSALAAYHTSPTSANQTAMQNALSDVGLMGQILLVGGATGFDAAPYGVECDVENALINNIGGFS